MQELKVSKRQEISGRIEEAKKLGDLSENSEYLEAKEAQEFNERRIAELEQLIKNSIIITKSSQKNIVGVGSTVKVKTNGETFDFYIVGSQETNPQEGRISNESPIGKAFLGCRVNDEVEVKAPSGSTKYKILKIM